jgi:3-oxoacyl-(acyl-carrier-protein) synthase
MKPDAPVLTGFGSVTPYGALAGLISTVSPEPSTITAWTTPELRRAFLVEPFRPASIVPGLKTRRLDRLSVWAVVASSLALRDAGIDLAKMDRSRIAVFFATGFGCVELTESFYRSAATHGWAETDPILFPETLSNAPAGHVALFHDLRGPNVTIGSQGFAAESALLQASSLLRHGQADLAIVLAGDTLTQAVYEWYETAHLLSSTCFSKELLPPAGGLIPSEGVVAMVLEPTGRQGARPYAALGEGRWAASGDAQSVVRRLLGDALPSFIICSGNGGPCASSHSTCSARELVGGNATILPAQPIATGIGDAGALLHLLLALSKRPGTGDALLLATSAGGGFAALRLELF